MYPRITRRIAAAVAALGFAHGAHASFALFDESQAFFVSKTGSDSNPGTKAAPFFTISQGLAAAGASSTKKRVLVATGTYAESLTIPNGVSVYGKFSASDWSRTYTATTTVQVPPGAGTRIGARANNNGNGGLIDGIDFVVPTSSTSGESSIGVLVNASPGFAVRYSSLQVGAGAAGFNASATAPVPPAPGGSGGPGQDGQSGGSGGGGGGTPGASTCGASGGQGGAGGYDMGSGANGGFGSGGTMYGAGSSSVACFGSGSNGGNGADGAAGANGAAGAAGGAGALTATGWAVQLGGTGGVGQAGRGGGGGGGGGGGQSSGFPSFCFADRGGGGGGGGAGGCGGTGGSGGQGGGASIGVLAFGSTGVAVSNTTVVRGAGGKGGNGQPGGLGGAQGAYGTPGFGPDDAADGGRGGFGGSGGFGGGGGGGAGGASYGLAAALSSSILAGNNTLAGGGSGAAGGGGSAGSPWAGSAGPLGPNLATTGSVSSLTMHALAVTRAGAGTGTVRADIGRVDCGATCADSIANGTALELAAFPAAGSRFVGWSGDCGGAATCMLTMSAARAVTATFAGLASLAASAMDFNGNGRSDILYRNVSTGQVYRLFMNGLATAGGAVVYSEPDTQWSIVQTGDFNGDGVTDLVWRHAGGGQVYVMTFNASGEPAGGAVVHMEPNPDWRIVHAPDLDGDGKSDLLWRNVATGGVYAMIMNGAAVAAQGFVYTEPDTNWKVVGVGDFAGSGKSNQLLWRHYGNGTLYMMTVQHIGGGGFTVSGQVIYAEPNVAWQVAGTADFDGDGFSDIVWRNTASGQVYVMLMEGPAIAEQGLVYTEPNPDWKLAAFGDYNGDGKADLLWRNEATGLVYMMLMNGLAIGGQGIVYDEPNTAWRVLGPRVFIGAGGVPQP